MGKPRLWPVFVTYAAVIVATLMFSLGLAVWVVIRSGPEALASPAEEWLTPGMLLVSSIIVEVSLLGAVLIAARPLTLDRLSMRRGGLGVGSVLVAAVGTLALSEALGLLVKVLDLHGWGTLASVDRAVRGLRGPRLGLALWVMAILPGVAEELFFRGFMQTRLRERWRSWVAVLVSAAAFGLIHGDPLHAPLALALGVWLGLVCERTGSVWPGVIAHVVNNAVATLESAFGVGSEQATAAAGVHPAVWAVLAGVFAMCAVLLARTKRPAPPPSPPPPSPPAF
jgi:uncharacterized protein